MATWEEQRSAYDENHRTGVGGSGSVTPGTNEQWLSAFAGSSWPPVQQPKKIRYAIPPPGPPKT